MRKAFTLLEMLVVIGIISILVAISTVSYSTVQRKARDARRKGDLSAMQRFLEQCYSINSYVYPSSADTPSHLTGTGTSSLTATCPADSSTLTITDPTTNKYNVSSTSNSYSIGLPLEDSTSFTVNNQQ